MKRFFPYILIITILTVFFNVTPTVEAQAAVPNLPACQYIDYIVYVQITNKPCIGTGVFDKGVVYQVDPPGSTSWLGCLTFGSFSSCLVNGATNVLASLLYTVLTMVSALLWIAGTLLDFVLRYTIVDMKKHLDMLTGINTAWKVIKDLMNMAFIFILVYEGIKLIIGQGSRETIKNFIVAVVIASLLVNFSLFFTKVLIDASNVVTLGFYDSIIDNTAITVGGGTTGGGTGASRSISGLSVPFMNALGLSSFWSGVSFDAIRSQTGGNLNMMILPLMGIILFLIVSFVFFAVAIMFTIRYLTLIILLILSPVAYMGAALPFMKTYADDWWKSLNGQLLFGPIYMVMTWVVLLLMSSSGFIVKGSWGDVLSGVNNIGTPYDQQPISLVFNFVIIIGLVIASLTIAKSTATKGSKHIGEATKRLTAFAGGAVMGAGASGFRSTIGRAGQAVASNQWLRDRVPDSRIARTLVKAGEKTGAASFDVRATEIGKATGTGKAGGKGGYQAEREKKINERMKFAEQLSDTVTGADVEAEMERRGYDKVSNEGRVNAYVVAGRSRADATALVAREAERERRAAQVQLIGDAAQNTTLRQERYLHNLSQTRWYTPNLYSGVSEDAEAARRMREGKKAKKGGVAKLIADFAAAAKEEEGEQSATTPATPATGTPPTP
ncbi:MAG: Uncharacterized protein CEO12_277 [Parcubacteria group bacterium Gr01-1014_46]|nr:MAG: Uncharacterized protein CEO12_277 [Parcubacteria group bacterium Gr01-1014_46]